MELAKSGILLLILTGFILTSCARMQRVETTVTKTEKDIQKLEKQVDNIYKAVEDLNINTGGATSKMKADLTMMLRQLDDQLEKLRAELDESQHRLKQLENKIDVLANQRVVTKTVVDSATGKVDTVKSDTILPGLEIEKIYNQARDDFINRKYKLAFAGFKSVYEAKESHNYRDNALYWMGECFYKTKAWDNALNYYGRCIKEFPNGKKACTARYKQGMVYKELGKLDEQKKSWESLIKSCPNTNEAKRAQDLLKEAAKAKSDG